MRETKMYLQGDSKVWILPVKFVIDKDIKMKLSIPF